MSNEATQPPHDDADEGQNQSTDRSQISKLPPLPVLCALGALTMVIVFAGLLLWPAGRVDWVIAWIYIAIAGSYSAINVAVIYRTNPILLVRRMSYGKGTKRWDIVWSALFAPLMIGVYVAAGLEQRWQPAVWSDEFRIALWLVGLLVFGLGSALFTWSMMVNPFFEKTVRLQPEHGQYVVDSGPYAVVRHPGYSGFSGWIVGSALLLGSTWAMGPAILSLLAIVLRTQLEDRTLRNELEGYESYTQRVRFRLIPGVW